MVALLYVTTAVLPSYLRCYTTASGESLSTLQLHKGTACTFAGCNTDGRVYISVVRHGQLLATFQAYSALHIFSVALLLVELHLWVHGLHMRVMVGLITTPSSLWIAGCLPTKQDNITIPREQQLG